MAKKKTTTKAKTKKPAKKVASKTAATKTTKNKVTKTTKKTSTNILTKLNLVSIVISLVGIAAAAIYMSGAYTQITVDYLVQNVLDNDVMSSAYRLLEDVSLQMLLIVTLVAATIKPLLDLTRNKASYQKALKAEYMPKRFLDMALQYAFFASITAAVLGYTSFVTVKLVAVLAVLVALFTWLAEKYSSSKEKALNPHALDYNNLTLLTIFVLALLLSFSMVFSYAFGQIIPTWHVILAWVLLVAYMLLNTLNQRMSIKGKKNFKDYKVVERNYLLIGTAARIDLAVILVLGFLK